MKVNRRGFRGFHRNVDATGARLAVTNLMLWTGWQRTNKLAHGEGRWPIGSMKVKIGQQEDENF